MKDDKDWKIGLLIVTGFGLSLIYTTVIFQTLKDEIYEKGYETIRLEENQKMEHEDERVGYQSY